MNSRGMTARKCRCGARAGVKETREMENGDVYRLRHCPHCKFQWRTIEQSVEWEEVIGTKGNVRYAGEHK